MSKLTIRRILPLSLLFFGSVNFVRSQDLSPYFGLGRATDSAGTSAAQGCPAGQLFDGLICEAAPTMKALLGVVGVDFLFRPHLGINGEYAFGLKRATFLPADGLTIRPSFYDLNAVWRPLSGKRFIPLLEGGLGGARTTLYFNQAAAITGITGTSAFPAGSDTSHFQLHFAVGMRIYVRGNLFVKPQFDLHYVRHLVDQFGRDAVLQYTGSLGYTFGKR